MKYIILILVSLLSISVFGCNTQQSTASNFDIKMANIELQRHSASFESIIALNPEEPVLESPYSYLSVYVNIIPSKSYTGEPFRTFTLKNEQMVQTEPLWLVVLSKDGYYFGNVGPIAWAPQELELPSSAERDVDVIKNYEAQRIKNFEIKFIPSSDISAVAFIKEVNEWSKSKDRDTLDYLTSSDFAYDLLSGNVPDQFSNESIIADIGSIFFHHFTLKIVTKEELGNWEAGE